MGKNQPNNFRKNRHCKGHTLKQVNIFPTDPRHPHLWHLEADWRSPPELHWKKDHQETGFCKSHKYKPLPWRTSFLQHKEIHSDSFVMRHIMNRDDHWRDLVVSSLNPSPPLESGSWTGATCSWMGSRVGPNLYHWLFLSIARNMQSFPFSPNSEG